MRDPGGSISRSMLRDASTKILTEAYQWVEKDVEVKIIKWVWKHILHQVKQICRQDIGLIVQGKSTKLGWFGWLPRLWIVEMCQENKYDSTCTCRSGQKIILCKHVVGMAIKYILPVRPISEYHLFPVRRMQELVRPIPLFSVRRSLRKIGSPLPSKWVLVRHSLH